MPKICASALSDWATRRTKFVVEYAFLCGRMKDFQLQGEIDNPPNDEILRQIARLEKQRRELLSQ